MNVLKKVNIFSLFCAFILTLFISKSYAQTESKKVFIHYMSWFGPNSYGRHWADGQPREPIIGYYDSRAWSTQVYHILQSWSCGIDGLVINVRDSYDANCLRLLTPALNRIIDVDKNFDYQFAVSYDDQGMGTVAIAEEKFSYLKNSILPNTNNYIYSQGKPVVFIWNYPGFLSAADYRTALRNVFTDSEPKVIWNEIDGTAQQDVNSFYPWVQGFAADGSNWGSSYLNWFYNTIGGKTSLDFATAGVWPGFDDRPCRWGQNRWIDRKDGEVYNKTWDYAKKYTGTLPLDWLIIETWNDWNEGSEIEPSVKYGFKYLQQTIDQIGAFKGSLIEIDDYNFLASTKIYEAASSIENKKRDSITYYPTLKRAINSFLHRKCSESIVFSDSIIRGGETGIEKQNLVETKFNIEAYPNPAHANVNLKVMLMEATKFTIDIVDINGLLVENIYTGFSNIGTKEIAWNTTGLARGVYYFSLTTKDDRKVLKFVLY